MSYKDHYRTGKTRKVIGLMNDVIVGKLMTEFATLRPKNM